MQVSVLGFVESSMLQDQGTSSTVAVSPLQAAGTCSVDNVNTCAYVCH